MATYWVRTKISLIALLFCLAVSTQAETINCITWECPTTSFSAADTSVSLDCEDEQIQIQNHGQTTNYDISPYVGNQIFGVSIKEGDSSEISVNNSMEYVSVWKMNDRGQWNLIGVIDIHCESHESQSSPYIAMNVCIDLPWHELTQWTGHTPLFNLVRIDGVEYDMSSGIYWSVPVEARWTWDLYIDGLHLISMEQTDEQECFVSSVYPQGA